MLAIHLFLLTTEEYYNVVLSKALNKWNDILLSVLGQKPLTRETVYC